MLRAKLLYNQQARKGGTVTTSVRKRKPKSTSGFMPHTLAKPREQDPYEVVVEEVKSEFGPYIPTLVEMLERGNFYH